MCPAISKGVWRNVSNYESNACLLLETHLWWLLWRLGLLGRALKSGLWPVIERDLISFTVRYCFLFRFVFIELVSSNLSCNLCLWYYNQLIHFHKEINANVYHHGLSGSILNVSTVHLNGIWHLIWRYLSKPVLGGHPVLSGTTAFPEGVRLIHRLRVVSDLSSGIGFTVCLQVTVCRSDFSKKA